MEQIAYPGNCTIFDVKWVPCSDKFIVMGSKPTGTGVLQMFQFRRAKLDIVGEIEQDKPFRCGSFGASSLKSCHLAVGDFNGTLQVIDLERPIVPVYNTKAHKTIINSIDTIGGTPEIVTGSGDGYVKVWDIRGGKNPVIEISPELSPYENAATQSRNCLAVTFGVSYNNLERSVAAGFDNGDLKLFDLRNMSVQWETTEKNGIVSIEFDQKINAMKKMVVTTLEGGLITYDMRTQDSQKGFYSIEKRITDDNRIIDGPESTVWSVKHLPHYNHIFATCDGMGSIKLWEYEYPNKRCKRGGNGYDMGAGGTINLLNTTIISRQPVHCFDWNPDKIGLGLCGSLDKTVRVLDTTKMNLY